MTRPSYFSRIFGASPVTPLQKHIDCVVACVEELAPYFEAVLAEDWEKAAAIHEKIDKLENDADAIKNELRLHLPSSLFMPVDRRDVLEVLDMQDMIANKSKDIAGLTLGRKMTLPKQLGVAYMNFLNRCIDTAKKAQTAVNELDELVVTGFRGDEADRVKNMIKELHNIEAETDKIQVSLRGDLYAIERDLPPVDVMFIYKIFEWTGDLADAALSTGNRLQLMIAK